MKLHTKAVNSEEITERERRNRDVAYRAALEGIVLLKNDGTLPVRPGKIALYGSGALYTIKGGSGSGEVNERCTVTILEGFRQAGFDVTNRTWLEDYQHAYKTCRGEFSREMKEKFKEAHPGVLTEEILGTMFQPPFGRGITPADITESDTDVCLYVLSRLSGEGKDRNPDTDFRPTAEEIEQLRLCAGSYRSTILVINTGAVMDLSAVERLDGVGAIVFFCMQGTEGGTALADIVSGKVCPSGRLTATWMKTYDDVPFGREYGNMGKSSLEADYREGIYVGYKYYDSFRIAPRYEFGYGLSYTTFEIRCLSATVDGTRIGLSVRVTNTGAVYSGKEVVQVYIQCPAGELDKPYQQLEAFAKTKTLTPGEAQTLDLAVDLTQASSFRERDAVFLLEKGDYVVLVGSSSKKTVPCAVVRLDGDAVVSRHRRIVDGQPVPDVLTRREADGALPAEAVRLTMKAADIACRAFDYTTRPSGGDGAAEALLARLTADDCVKLVVGDGMDNGRKGHGFTTPGAAGYTTSELLEKGVPDINLSDGPAGLRLQKTSGLSETGELRPIEVPMGAFEFFREDILRDMLGDPARDTLLYQFTTAFPVAVSLGQTWNLTLIDEVGRAISAEMSEYGTTFWLAPGMNIHRNPLCGRNYEYFSEDPYLTGKSAAAIVSGIQSMDGNYATLKHFCCNNQETNRRAVSANVGERALREVYLRGFGIAVTESRPRGVMTAYNKVNGVYACNAFELNTLVLRNEWGFDGVVMTDWTATAEDAADPARAIAAGNDLLMPGMPHDMEVLRGALQRGELKEDDLRRCALNILRSILDSRRVREER